MNQIDDDLSEMLHKKLMGKIPEGLSDAAHDITQVLWAILAGVHTLSELQQVLKCWFEGVLHDAKISSAGADSLSLIVEDALETIFEIIEPPWVEKSLSEAEFVVNIRGHKIAVAIP